MQLLFVFGTLKEGFPNFDANRGIRIDGEFVTMERFPLYLVGDRCSPWLVNDSGSGEHVQGEVYSVDGPALEKMDMLERISEPNGYSRIETAVRNIETGAGLAVYVYMKQSFQLNPKDIVLGPLKRYELEHALRYSSRYV